MTVPRATYRLQLHRGFTLRDAAKLVPYLETLGVSHLYCPPLLKARPGSTHGYDVCDPARLNPELGSEADLAALVVALRERGMGLVLDIVPNHMATAPENPWWWDVLKHGRQSRFAEYFDIDWDPPEPPLRGKVLAPVLGDDLERVLELGELKVTGEGTEVTVRYFDQSFPVTPSSLPTSDRPLDEWLTELNSNRQAMAAFLDQQHYLLASWRRGDSHLNYRRFFSVTHLAGMRVELPHVFAALHERILEWHRRGWIDGLRVDHPDGLRDPQGYLERLCQSAPGAWLVVEKILMPAETLPPAWPVAGTTGYDFMNRTTALLVNPEGEQPLTDLYAEFIGESPDYAGLVRAKKRWVLKHYLAAEVARLGRLLAPIVAQHTPRREFTPDALREALIELVACFPVYRTYCEPEKAYVSDVDRSRLAEASALALRADSASKGQGQAPPATAGSRAGPDPAVLDFLSELLQLRLPSDSASEFVMRFQQLTGPAMAKGVEDSAFYCYNRFVALNEVGGDPSHFALSVGDFHRACEEARQHWPTTMLATSTHDTKRSEDVRARLALLSEIPAPWAAAVRRWSALTEKYRRNGWPDRNDEYLIYQTLVGAWPLSLDRALAYFEKAACEAKRHTDWTNRNADFEAALEAFVADALGDRTFLNDFEQFVTPLIRAGFINSLAQTLLKLTSPGVPDLYQGNELWDFSLVDPDNRRPVDFERRRALLAELQHRWETGNTEALLKELLENPDDGRLKLFVTYRTLRYRHHHPELFERGSYVPLSATGQLAEHTCVFARTLEAKTAITVVPRLVLGLTGDREGPPVGANLWGDTRLVLPKAQVDMVFQNFFTTELVAPVQHGADTFLRLADVMRRFPVALLVPVETFAKPASSTSQVR